MLQHKKIFLNDTMESRFSCHSFRILSRSCKPIKENFEKWLKKYSTTPYPQINHGRNKNFKGVSSTRRLYSVMQQPAWFKNIGGTYEAVEYDCREDVLTAVSRPTIVQCKENQVLVRVAYAGICTEDLRLLSGRMACRKQRVVPGHEISGYVTKIGKNVTKVAVGDKVAVNPIRSCGDCEECLRMMPNYCKKFGSRDVIGFDHDGGWAEYCAVSEEQVFKIDHCIHTRHGLLCTTLSTNLRAWNMVMPVPPDTRFLILGATIYGKLMMAMLHKQGYKRVVITDHCELDRANLRKYSACALDYQILSPFEVSEKSMCGSRGKGFDVVFACTQNVFLLEQALIWMRPRGKMVIFGCLPCEGEISLYGNIFFNKELQIMGAWLNPYTFQLAVDWARILGGKYLELYPLGIKAFDLKDYKKAVRAATDGSITKAVFKFEKSSQFCYL